jgi:hypothetical protein
MNNVRENGFPIHIGALKAPMFIMFYYLVTWFVGYCLAWWCLHPILMSTIFSGGSCVLVTMMANFQKEGSALVLKLDET